MAAELKDVQRELNLSNICDGNMIKLLTSHLQAVGVPKEYIFFPLLTTVASCLGLSSIKINDEWTEKCTLWTAVLARKGSKRSAVLDRFVTSITESSKQTDDQSKSSCHHSAAVNVIYDEGLNKDILESNEKNLALFEDLTSSEIFEKDIMHMSKKSYDIRPSTKENSSKGSLNMFSFLPPDTAMTFLEDTNVDISSRFLVACPKSSVVKSSNLKNSMPSNTPSLSAIFKTLQMVHSEPIQYGFSPQAKVAFDGYYDVLQEGMIRFDRDESNFCILSKAAGHLARVCVVLSALRQALKAVVYHETVSPANWNVEITTGDIEASKLIMDYCIDIRFTLLNKVSMFKPRQIMQGNGMQQSANVNFMSEMSSRETSSEPHVKRLRVASADAGQEQGGISSSAQSQDAQRISNEVPDSLQVIQETVGQNQSRLPGLQPTFSATSPRVMYSNPSLCTSPGSSDVTGSGFFSGCPGESEEYYLPGRRNSSYMDCSMLSNEDLCGYNDEQQTFIRRFGYKIKKLLEYKADWCISPSCCAQRHLMPPIPKTEMARYDTQTRYPVNAAKEYLSKVAELGFGIIESIWHATNNRRSLIFKKLTYDTLRSVARSLLATLQVNLDEYTASFTAPPEALVVTGASEMHVDLFSRDIQSNVSSSSTRFPVPYTHLQQHTGTGSVSGIHTETPEDSSESSIMNSETSVTNQFFKSEPHDDGFL